MIETVALYVSLAGMGFVLGVCFCTMIDRWYD